MQQLKGRVDNQISESSFLNVVCILRYKNEANFKFISCSVNQKVIRNFVTTSKCCPRHTNLKYHSRLFEASGKIVCDKDNGMEV